MGNRFVSVICEYNPLHRGHAFMLERVKGEFGAAACILSGDIVQRGTPAVAPASVRAAAAVGCGANLVVSLPIPWCCSSARDFAAAGVHIARLLGSGALAFGAEDRPELLHAIAEFTSRPEFAAKVKELITREGNLSYPAAFRLIAEGALGAEAGAACAKPNNILALEYLKNLAGTGIEPYIIQREPAFASSSEIRELRTRGEMLAALPEQSAREFAAYVGFPRAASRLDSLYIGTLRLSQGFTSGLYSLTKELYAALVSAARTAETAADLASLCTDRSHTRAHVRRALNSLVFGITTARVAKMPRHTALLAADCAGREILRAAPPSELCIIARPGDARRGGVESEYLFAKRISDAVSLSAPGTGRVRELPLIIGRQN